MGLGKVRLGVATLLVAALSATMAVAARDAGARSAHSDPCHTRHLCPSDHHSYAWATAGGPAWECAKDGASEVTAADTTAITYDGRPYRCHPAGATATPPVASEPAPAPAATPARTPARGSCRARGSFPDPDCTPGAVFKSATRAQVCVPGYSSSVRNVPESVKRSVYAKYGIVTRTRGQYEVDHLISLELGGSNAIANLWPEEAQAVAGFRQKDRLENALHREVCAGRLSLALAQRKIATNWDATYRSLG